MTLGKAAPSGLEANAYVKRTTDGKELSCSSAGGNGKVLPGQASCYTPIVYDLDPRSSYVIEKYYQPEPSLMPIKVRIHIEAAVYESTLSARVLFSVLSVPVSHFLKSHLT